MSPPQPPRPALRPPPSRPLVREEPASVPPAVRASLADARVATEEAIAALAEVYERRLHEQHRDHEAQLQEARNQIADLTTRDVTLSGQIATLQTNMAATIATIVTHELSKKFPTEERTEAIAKGAVSGDKGKTAGLSAAVSILITACAMAAPGVMKSCSEPPKEFTPQRTELPHPDPSMPAGAPRK